MAGCISIILSVDRGKAHFVLEYVLMEHNRSSVNGAGGGDIQVLRYTEQGGEGAEQ